MGFWADANTEPKRADRFLMYINGIPEWMISKTGKPSPKISVVKKQYLNHTFKYPGKVEWESITFTLNDPVEPDASATLMNILWKSGYAFPDAPNDHSTISKARAIAALGNVHIDTLGADGEVTERWRPVNAWISGFKLSDQDYAADEMNNAEVTIEFDYAELDLKIAGDRASK